MENLQARVGLKEIQPSAVNTRLTINNDRLDSNDQQSCQKKRRLSTVGASKKRKTSFPVFEDKQLKLFEKRFADKSIDTEDLNSRIPSIEQDLCSGEPSENYWKELAECRREALESSLAENEQLHGQVATLTARVSELEQEASKYEELAERAEQLADTVKLLTGDLDDEISESSDVEASV